MAKRSALIRVQGEARFAYARATAIIDEVHGKPLWWHDCDNDMRSDDPVESLLGMAPMKFGGTGFPKDTMIVVETFDDDNPDHCLIYVRFFLGASVLQAVTMGFSPKLNSGADEVIRRIGGTLLDESSKTLGF